MNLQNTAFMDGEWQSINESDLKTRLKALKQQLNAGLSNQPQIVSWSVCGQTVTAPACVQLAEKLKLTSHECDVLLLGAAIDLDPEFFEVLSNSPLAQGIPAPTIALASQLIGPTVWRAVSPNGALRRLRLIELQQSHGTPMIFWPIRVDERIVNFLRGQNEIDDRLLCLLQPWDDSLKRIPLVASQQRLVGEIQNRFESSRQRSPVFQLIGPHFTAKRAVAGHLADRWRIELLQLNSLAIPADAAEQETMLRLWERELALRNVSLYVEISDSTPSELARIKNWLTRVAGIVFVDSSDPLEFGSRFEHRYECQPPTSDEQRALWTEHLGVAAEPTANLLAGQFQFDASVIAELAAADLSLSMTRSRSADAVNQPPQPQDERLWNACRVRRRPQLDGLASRIDCKSTWFDLVLPAELDDTLHEIAAHVRHRGRVLDEWGFTDRMNRGTGVTVLFAGESGTGKSMAAEVLANDLQLDLYRIDLSAVVDKFIGETEKNLRRLFDAAEGGGVILFFDEADALFGKRSEVRDSHDRYANIETNYLLQRLESFRGLAILATNLKCNLDGAFLRRLRYVVNFPLPDRQERLLMWQRFFPSQAPVAELDYAQLADLPLTGGNIHTIAMNAAFAGTNDAGRIEMQHLLKAAQVECIKLKKPTSLHQFQLRESESWT